MSRRHRTGSLAPVQKLGAIPGASKQVEFRVWAPDARSLAVRLGEDDHALARELHSHEQRYVHSGSGDALREIAAAIRSRYELTEEIDASADSRGRGPARCDTITPTHR